MPHEPAREASRDGLVSGPGRAVPEDTDASLVSCIVPVYNGERFLREAIESVLAQEHRPLEIIVVDDGSTDDTSAIARAFGPPVRYVRQENAGPATARNRGLKEAGGAYIGFVDADDLWEPDKLRKQLARFAARPEIGYCVGMSQNFWEEEVRDEAERLRDHPRARPVAGYTTLTLLARRDLFERVGGFDTSLAHGDAADWFQRADDAGASHDRIDEVLTRRRLHGANRSRRKSSTSRDEFLHLLKARLDRRRAAARTAPASDAPDGDARADPAPIRFAHAPATGRVTCVVPAFNAERFVAEAVRSILEQTHPDTEVVVVDDGSTDDTVRVLEPFGDAIRLIRQQNAGPAAARNAGIEQSRGEYLAFLDADDLWEPGKLAAQIAVLQARPEVDLCAGDIVSFWVPELAEEAERKRDLPYYQRRAALSPCTILARRRVFDAVGGFDPERPRAEDTDWFLRVMNAGLRIERIDELVARRRHHEANLTREQLPSQTMLMDMIRGSLGPEG